MNRIFTWRDNNGLEIDLIIEEGNSIIPVEIKATQNFFYKAAGKYS